MNHKLSLYVQRVLMIRRLREMVKQATELTGGIIPRVSVRGTFETDNGLLFADGSWYRVRNIKSVYCEIYIYDDGDPRWVRAAYYSPFDVLIESE